MVKMYEFVSQIKTHLEKNNVDDALEMILSDSEQVQQSCLEIFAMIFSHMRSLNPDDVTWDTCKSIIDHLTDNCKPKEVLVSLMEQAEALDSCKMFHLILKPLERTLIRLTDRGSLEKPLKQALDCLYAYISRLPLPDNRLLEGKELFLVENCENSKKLLECVEGCLEFLEPFASYALHCSESKENKTSILRILVVFLVRLLESPVGYFQFSPVGTCDFKNCTQNLIQVLLQLVSHDIIKLNLWACQDLQLFENGFDPPVTHSDGKNASGALALLFYFIFVENLALLPSVYECQFLLEVLGQSCIPLLGANYNEHYLYKGATTLDTFLDRCQKPWDDNFLSLAWVQDLHLALINAMQRSNELATRKTALSCFQKSLGLFTAKGKTGLIKLIYAKASSGSEPAGIANPDQICGWLIDQFRNLLSASDGDTLSPEYYQQLPEVLPLFVRLDAAERTDLMENFNRIQAALNLLYVLKKAGLENQEFFGSALWRDRVLLDFIPNLARALELSIGHYELETREEKDAEKVKILQNCVSSFNLIQMSLGRLNEVLD